ncbi:MAG: type II toxin-antitoxin system RelE/ParE family toxin [Pseudomonadota bacterium]|nr:type II toxin-antitoxin system RelE/ParE family toxin [Pseudomonadota bacterium]
MKNEVELLEGVEVFLETLPQKLEAKAYWTMLLLQRMGTELKEPYCKPVKGARGLFELRVKQASDIVRLFYFQRQGSIFVVTSGYVKKSQKLNRLEIEKAQRLRERFIQEETDGQT